MIENESEDFEKVVTFSGDEIAIVDAAVVKALKHTPLAKGIIYVPLKSSVKNPSFKVVARYDDATLRRLVISPAASGEAEPDSTTPPDKRDDLSENAVNQPAGHGGDRLARKAKLPSLKNSRQHRNSLNAKRGPTVDPSDMMAGIEGQIGAKIGDPNPDVGPNPEKRLVKQAESRRRSPHPSVRVKQAESRRNPFVESVCSFLKKVKESSLSEAELRELPNKREMLQSLSMMRSRCFGGWRVLDEATFVNENAYVADPRHWDLRDGFLVHKGGKNYDFDLLYEAIKLLESIREVERVEPINSNDDEVQLFEELILRKLNLE